MSGKQQVLDSIGAIAKQLGRAPSHSEFFSRAGISRYAVAKFFPKWNDAVRAAGLIPRTLRVQLQDSELLTDWGETARSKRALPSWRGYLVGGEYYPPPPGKRFRGRASVSGAS